ncbi:MAG: histidine phosphatase family protein [Rhodospirillaceae bacterium]
MTVTTRWWWIRHAPVVNHSGRIYGHTDVDCDTGNTRLSRALAQMLPARPVLVVTPLRRTARTLEAILAERTAKPVDSPEPLPEFLIEPDLREQHFGAWTGMTHAEVARQRGAEAHRFWISPAHERPEGGESFADVVDRVGHAVARLSAKHAGRDIVVVAHGGSIRAALAIALGVDPETALRFSVFNQSLTRIDHIAPGDGSPAVWRIESVNMVPY